MGSVLHSKNPAEGVQSAVKIRPLANTHHELERVRAAPRVIPSLVSPRDLMPVTRFCESARQRFDYTFLRARVAVSVFFKALGLSYYEIRVQPD
jgi:hypothetical protein